MPGIKCSALVCNSLSMLKHATVHKHGRELHWMRLEASTTFGRTVVTAYLHPGRYPHVRSGRTLHQSDQALATFLIRSKSSNKTRTRSSRSLFGVCPRRAPVLKKWVCWANNRPNSLLIWSRTLESWSMMAKCIVHRNHQQSGKNSI